MWNTSCYVELRILPNRRGHAVFPPMKLLQNLSYNQNDANSYANSGHVVLCRVMLDATATLTPPLPPPLPLTKIDPELLLEYELQSNKHGETASNKSRSLRIRIYDAVFKFGTRCIAAQGGNGCLHSDSRFLVRIPSGQSKSAISSRWILGRTKHKLHTPSVGNCKVVYRHIQIASITSRRSGMLASPAKGSISVEFYSHSFSIQ